jgi:hypothetical protein
MKLWMSAEIDRDVFDVYRVLMLDVEARVNSLLAESTYGGSIDKWSVIPIISALQPHYREIARVSKKGRSAEFRLRIPHAEFKHATPDGQRRLIVELLKRSVRMMPTLGAHGLDVDRLVHDLDRTMTDAEA